MTDLSPHAVPAAAWLDNDLRMVRYWRDEFVEQIEVAVCPAWLQAMGLNRARLIAEVHKAVLVEKPADPECGIEAHWPGGSKVRTCIRDRALP